VTRRALLGFFLLILALSALPGRAQLPDPLEPPAVVLYAALGPELSTYAVNMSRGALLKTSRVALPFAIQYAWPHPSKKFLYVAWSNGMQGDRHGVTAYQIDPATGALTQHGAQIDLRYRPVHLTVDADGTHVLVAYNNPSSLSVHVLNADGTLGRELKQGPLDTGIYAHQIRVHPANRMVVMVTRGNAPTGNRAEDPGSLKIYRYKNGVLANRGLIAPNGGYGYQSRHIDFHPTQPWMYLNLERQNQLQMYRILNDDSVDPKPVFTKDTLDNQAAAKPAQTTAAIHVHPNGRFVYLSNRASGTVTVDGKQIWEGGENSIGVYAINEKTGEPVRIQNADTRGMHPRTFTLDDGGRLLVAANQSAVVKREGERDARVPASLAVFRIGADGKLAFVRKYDVVTDQARTLMWVGMVTLTK
jgi:6-phosphogluconolactonase (cycloisomerase 2 family)